MTRHRASSTFIVVMSALVVVIAAVACEPVPGRIALAGDSISYNAGVGGAWQGYDTAGKIVIGGQAFHVQDRVQADVNDPTRSAEYWVFAFGSNEVGNGWTLSDYAAWDQLTNTPDPASCVVWIKLWNLPPTMPVGSARHVHMNEARRTIDVLVSERLRSVAVDWRPVVTADPSLLANDGVHLNPDGGPEAYQALVQEGLNQC